MQFSHDNNLNLIAARVERGERVKFVDLFCGLGGFRLAFEKKFDHGKCVFSCDFDVDAQRSYQTNFNETPFGDVTQIDENQVPAHDVLFAGFPCQAFSICGDGRGFEDTRGTLFFDIARILEAKKRKPLFWKTSNSLFRTMRVKLWQEF